MEEVARISSDSHLNLKIMKRNPKRLLCYFILILHLSILSLHGQDPAPISQQVLDMKLELLNSQIELFNSQLKVWETKPAELEQRLTDVDQRIDQLAFDPVYFNNKLTEIELLIEDQKSVPVKAPRKSWRPFRPDSVITEPYKTAIALNPVRLMEGTFHIIYERALTPKLGIGISGLATYATEQGISGFYMSNQALSYYNDRLASSMPYNNKNISGYGLELTVKNYLLTDIYKRQRSPVGLYASPNLLFRRLWLSGISEYYFEDEWVEEEVTRLLNIYAAGARIGWKFTLLKVLYVDLYAGGQIRLAKYDDEERFTKYKNLANIDFSGVMPTAGVSIGILK